MRIVLEQEGQHLIMSVAYEDDPQWNATITDIDIELNGRQGVRRMSYDTWWWDLRRKDEAEAYITYFYLKHGK